MVLDKDALPLTRIWCIFEVLPTFKRQREDSTGQFEGLVFCTDRGTLGSEINELHDSTSYDVALALARRLADLRVQDAKASRQQDHDMISATVEAELGGMDELNHFIRENMSGVLFHAELSFLDKVRRWSVFLSDQAPAPSRALKQRL